MRPFRNFTEIQVERADGERSCITRRSAAHRHGWSPSPAGESPPSCRSGYSPTYSGTATNDSGKGMQEKCILRIQITRFFGPPILINNQSINELTNCFINQSINQPDPWTEMNRFFLRREFPGISTPLSVLAQPGSQQSPWCSTGHQSSRLYPGSRGRGEKDCSSTWTRTIWAEGAPGCRTARSRGAMWKGNGHYSAKLHGGHRKGAGTIRTRGSRPRRDSPVLHQPLSPNVIVIGTAGCGFFSWFFHLPLLFYWGSVCVRWYSCSPPLICLCRRRLIHFVFMYKDWHPIPDSVFGLPIPDINNCFTSQLIQP